MFIKIASLIRNLMMIESSFMIIFSQANSRKLYELCLSAIQMYSKHNLGRSDKICVPVDAALDADMMMPW